MRQQSDDANDLLRESVDQASWPEVAKRNI